MAATTWILSSPLPTAIQLDIAQSFWCSTDNNLESFFIYYTDQCKIVYYAFDCKIPLKTHDEITFIAKLLRKDLSRSYFLDLLQTRSPGYNVEAVGGAIDLVVRLMTMMDVGRFPPTSFSGRHSITWDNGTLKDFLHEKLPKQTRRSHDGIRLDTSLTVRHLDRIGGLSVKLTTNLADHLLLRPEKDEVFVFHHASFLLSQKGDLFPAGLVEETLSTLALLFPKGDVEVQKWYDRQGNDNLLDRAVLSCDQRHRDIEDFQYWHDPLVTLLQRFEHPRHINLRRAWFDRRDGAHWYSLWAAITLTVFFGLLQSIEGGIQTYRSYMSN
ncbi:hypothetical protein M406DRAFT_265359 [Cryphonectria parasitica EP155]|uniref:Uncharacterized protein n=1 Tax=Cryphonectria parasitica (strain ATCC 38755 / EP155) TaxID=660469 RepID=A0A9P4XWC3_CRYP1|nr:uncharacterized protein M406DRAFT_265359 [Cryphonectria parasitica EP155]KAF3761980.1 hypothetical protein M406DRAFT_265359 [Cryphonectria parasitica EP155]